jgi:signal transduction histidine kinase
VVLFVGIVISIITGLSDLIVKDIEFVDNNLRIIYGVGMFPFLVVISFLIFVTLYFLFKKYFKVLSKEKIKLEYFLVGVFVFYLANIIFNIVLPLFFNVVRFYYLGDYSTIILLILTAYAITRHELMGIKTLLTQTLIIVISIILLLDVFLLSDNLTMQLLKIGILLTFLYFSRELVKSVRKEREARSELEATYKKINDYVRQLEKMNESLEEKNKDLKALLESSGRVAETLDPKKIAQDIVDSIPKRLKHLGYKGGIITLYDRDKKLVYAYAITELEIVKKAKKLLSKPFRKHSESVDGVSNLTIQTVKTGKIYIGGKLEEFIAPTVSKKICKLIQKLVGAKSFMSIPLFSRGKVVGAIIFVAVKPLEKIEQRDKDILYVFSSHIGSAIENARLYEKTSRQMNELSRLNENLKEANQKLEELLKIKNEFLHITSHQLRTPLTAIRGMISMWYEGDFDNLSEKERKEIIKRICISTERLNNITNDMLDALELEGGFMKFQFKPVSLERVIRETIDMLKPNYNKKNLYINLNVKSKDLPKIELEPNYIRQVFLNLIDNACKYTKKGGVDIDIKRVQKHIDVTIRDTGIGVSKSDQGKIFQKFTRGRNAIKENASGSGLGLFIAKRIVDEHQGKIEFHSAGIGKGSTVKVSLPVRQEK